MMLRMMMTIMWMDDGEDDGDDDGDSGDDGDAEDDDGDNVDDDGYDNGDNLDAQLSYKALRCKILECWRGSTRNECSISSPAFAHS